MIFQQAVAIFLASSPAHCGEIMAMRQTSNNETIELVIESSNLGNTKDWEQSGSLPLSVESAMAIARGWLKETGKNNAKIVSFKIQNSPCISVSHSNKWYFIIDYSYSEKSDQGLDDNWGVIAILFDGTVISPKKVAPARAEVK